MCGSASGCFLLWMVYRHQVQPHGQLLGKLLMPSGTCLHNLIMLTDFFVQLPCLAFMSQAEMPARQGQRRLQFHADNDLPMALKR